MGEGKMNNDYVVEMARSAKEAGRALASSDSERKDEALLKIADALEENTEKILDANAADVADAKKQGMSTEMVQRLMLNEGKVRAMADSVREIARLRNPVGEIVERIRRPNGLEMEKTRVPFGVIAVIYESRPNVTVEAAALCLKSGNAIILRGGSEAIRSNKALADIMMKVAEESGIPKAAISFVDKTDREIVRGLLKMNQYVDVIIPRGGQGLIDFVLENSRLPVLASGGGNCHIYVDVDADLEMAERITVNAKTSSPYVCNAAEKLLVHEKVAEEFFPRIAKALREKGVELVGCAKSAAILKRSGIRIGNAGENDWHTEYLALKMALKVVKSAGEAIAHINNYSTAHSESIVTRNESTAGKFLKEVDSAAVYHNASTRFTDGGEFGFGGEMGISTQKLHARGPIGLAELTSIKYVIKGNGQLRGEPRKKIALLGAGKMGGIIARGLIRNRAFDAKDVLVTGRDREKLNGLRQLGATVKNSNLEAAEESSIVIIAVKPGMVSEVASEISEACKGKLVISIAAMVPLKEITRKIPGARVIRAMPNTGAMADEGFTALYSENADWSERHEAEQLFRAFGECLFVDSEEKINALTGISGSGPAYFFLLTDALAKTAENKGIGKKEARRLAAQTVLGAAKVMLENETDAEELIRLVASPKGTTEAALEHAKKTGLVDAFAQMVEKAIGKAGEKI